MTDTTEMIDILRDLSTRADPDENPDDCPLCDGIGEISTADRQTVECPHCITRDIADLCRAALQTRKECDANSDSSVRAANRQNNAQPPSVMAGAEIPVAWGEFYGDKCASVTLKPGRFNTVPLYRSQPAMAGTEAMLT